MSDLYIKAVAPSVSRSTATLMKTGQTTSYRTGDDGDLEAGRDVDFFTLAENNPFGNTNRFTDELGGSTYANNWVIDWSTYNGNNVLGWYRIRVDLKTFSEAIDECLANTFGTFNGCRLPNIVEFLSIFNWGVTGNALNYTPFIGVMNNLVSSSYDPNTSSTNTFYVQTFSILSAGRTNPNFSYIPVRTFTVTGTILS